jgi:hypothetical protein
MPWYGNTALDRLSHEPRQRKLSKVIALDPAQTGKDNAARKRKGPGIAPMHTGDGDLMSVSEVPRSGFVYAYANDANLFASQHQRRAASGGISASRP